MRTASFQTRNNQTIEVFQERREGHFELWVVGSKATQRMIMNHYLTHDDLEARLRYSKSVLLSWRLAIRGDLPVLKSPMALKEEETIECGTFWDSEELSEHLGGVLTLDCDREALNAAKEHLAGSWSDGASSLTFGADSTFRCSISGSSNQSFLRAMALIQPDGWSLSESWQLRVMNRTSLRGERRLVHRVLDTELHLTGGGNCIAYVFKRIPA